MADTRTVLYTMYTNIQAQTAQKIMKKLFSVYSVVYNVTFLIIFITCYAELVFLNENNSFKLLT